MTAKVVLSTLVFCILAWDPGILRAEEPSIHGTLKADPVFQDSKGLAIRGYDPVAYFLAKKPVKGKSEFEHAWMGATWRFSTAANRDLFIMNPEKYAPQYGGYCAYGMSRGYAAPIDPKAWTVVDDKLYLNYDRDVRNLWNDDIPGHIARANQNWPRIPKKMDPH